MPNSQFTAVDPTWIVAGASRPNTFTAQQVFKSPTTTNAGAVFQATGTISAIPTVDANAIALFQGTEAVVSHVLYASSGQPNHVYFRRNNGTYAVPTAIANADILGSIQWQGRGATTFGSTVQAQIRAVATQAFTDTAKGTDLVFLTTPSATATGATALTLNSVTATFAGQVIGTGTASTAGGASFRSNGTISAIPTPSANISAQFITAQASTGFIQLESSGAVNYLQFRRRNGTYAVPTAIASNDRLGTVSWAGQWGTTVGNLGTEDANFFAYATEAFTSTARGTGFVFETTTTGTTTLATRLTLSSSSATFTVPVIATEMQISNSAGTTRTLFFRTSGSTRFIANVTATAESGSNAGSNFEIRRYSDAGADLGLVIDFTRSNGNITFNTGGGTSTFANDIIAPFLQLNRPVSNIRPIIFRTSGSTRWEVRVNGGAESGSNVGSNFEISRYSDAGADLGSVMSATRSTGNITFNGGGGKTTFSANAINISTAQSPASNGTGTTGDVAWDTSYLYICTATNTWKRVALSGGY
jgi:hypothetical protein